MGCRESKIGQQQQLFGAIAFANGISTTVEINSPAVGAQLQPGIQLQALLASAQLESPLGRIVCRVAANKTKLLQFLLYVLCAFGIPQTEALGDGMLDTLRGPFAGHETHFTNLMLLISKGY